MANKKPDQAPSETLRVDGRKLAPLFPDAMKARGRPRCLRAVFHEYAHALQQWRIGAKQSPNEWGLSKA
jgi:hypothetical protein